MSRTRCDSSRRLARHCGDFLELRPPARPNTKAQHSKHATLIGGKCSVVFFFVVFETAGPSDLPELRRRRRHAGTQSLVCWSSPQHLRVALSSLSEVLSGLLERRPERRLGSSGAKDPLSSQRRDSPFRLRRGDQETSVVQGAAGSGSPGSSLALWLGGSTTFLDSRPCHCTLWQKV